MEVRIQNWIKYSDAIQTHEGRWEDCKNEFTSLLRFCSLSNTKEELRNNLNGESYHYFVFGFGGSHFWASQIKPEGGVRERIIFVEFPRK